MSSESETLTEYAHGYEPMPGAPEKDKRETYSADPDGIRDAAKEVVEARAAGELPQVSDSTDDPSIIDRSYQYYQDHGDAKRGDKPDPKFTLSLERAADDLATIRQLEAAADAPAADDVAAAIDKVRGFDPQQQPQPDAQQFQPQQQADSRRFLA
jgi:hypothetical protein